jgi:hypothetical protein
MIHHITIADGMLCVDGGVSLTGVSIDMVTNLRSVFVALSELCESLDGVELPEEAAFKLHAANSILNYLRATRQCKG